jgi:hypothetical protein
VIARAISPERVRDVLVETGTASERERDLPAQVMGFCCEDRDGTRSARGSRSSGSHLEQLGDCIALCREQEVDRLAAAVHRSISIGP